MARGEEKIICIVEDKDELREALSLIIQFSDNYLLGGSYSNAETALEEISEVMPDAVLMDINLPGSSGIDCVLQLKNMFPKMLFLMCTSHEDNELIFDSLKAGASGYLLKAEGSENIIAALDDMLSGGSPMSSSIARKVVASFKTIEAKNHCKEILTEREKEVLDALAKGMLNKEVADFLQISQGTVRKHIQNIYEKLQVNTRVEALNLYYKR